MRMPTAETGHTMVEREIEEVEGKVAGCTCISAPPRRPAARLPQSLRQ
jgi:hypothetical protein